MKRTGLSLVIAGLLGAIFFVLTDPRFGFVRWLGSGEGIVDAANQAFIGTVIGLAASAIFFVLGLWLLTRRTT